MKRKCPNCGGMMVAKQIEYEKKIGSKRMLFEDVPADVCVSCEEVWIDGKVLQNLEKVFLKPKKTSRYLSIPVLSYSKVG